MKVIIRDATADDAGFVAWTVFTALGMDLGRLLILDGFEKARRKGFRTVSLIVEERGIQRRRAEKQLHVKPSCSLTRSNPC